MSANKFFKKRPQMILTQLIVGVFCAASVCAQQPAAAPDLKTGLEAILKKQAVAWNDGDLERFMEAYWQSDELTFCSGGNVTRGWKQTLERYRTRYGSKDAMGHLTFAELEVTELGSDAALMLGRWNLVAQGKEFGGNFSLVWRKIKGDWKIIHDHTSSTQPPAQDEKKTSNQ